jgi:uncharacterized protein with HEPN domain
MSKRSTILLLKDMYESISVIETFLIDFTEDEFYSDRKTKDAVVRNLEIIGEASNQLNKKFKEENVHVLWREAGDLRNRMIHDYSGIDYIIVWEIIHDELPHLKQQLEELITNITTAS